MNPLQGQGVGADGVGPTERALVRVGLRAAQMRGAEGGVRQGGAGRVGPKGIAAEVSVARRQNLIPSFPWIAPGLRLWGRNPRIRKGRDRRDQILRRSVAEP